MVNMDWNKTLLYLPDIINFRASHILTKIGNVIGSLGSCCIVILQAPFNILRTMKCSVGSINPMDKCLKLSAEEYVVMVEPASPCWKHLAKKADIVAVDVGIMSSTGLNELQKRTNLSHILL